MDPRLIQLQLLQFYHQQRLLTWASSHQLPSSPMTRNKPDYLVSSSWFHTATRPCFPMINPWIPPLKAAASKDRSVHVCVRLWVWAGASSRVYFCHGPPPHLRGPVTGDAEGCVYGRTETSVLSNRTWDLICERWSVSHRCWRMDPCQRVCEPVFVLLQPIINQAAAAPPNRVGLIEYKPEAKAINPTPAPWWR